MENINSWSDVNWREINRRVYRLQVRIYKASQNDDRDKMHKLQKLLITGNSAKLLAVRRVTQEEGKTDSFKAVSSCKRIELARLIRLDGKSNSSFSVNILNPDRNLRSLGILKLEDSAKQSLVTLALQPQWDAKFEFQTVGFRFVNDATKAIFLSISKKQKWILAVYMEQCFDAISYKKLLVKCNTFSTIEIKLNQWLKAGILYRKSRLVSQGRNSYGVISRLLFNILLHGLQDRLELYANSLPSGNIANKNSMSYISYSRDFVIMHPDLEVIQKSKEITTQFLEEMDLKLSSFKTKIVHTFDNYEGIQLRFPLLRLNIVQKRKCNTIRKSIFMTSVSDKSFVTLIIPLKEIINSHRLNLRKLIKKYKGVSQENLIHNLNLIICDWALSKQIQVSSKILSEMDMFIHFHLWSWARKRHPKMSQAKIKAKYWHIIGKSHWVFGIKSKETETKITKFSVLLQKHSAIKSKTRV
jgi:RNA-directed DNA polymerase